MYAVTSDSQTSTRVSISRLRNSRFVVANAYSLDEKRETGKRYLILNVIYQEGLHFYNMRYRVLHVHY